ncbi:MAG: LPS export ABC transporter periplasmic protein LptC [Candidatus Bipolaricaulia bacterium]
MSRTRFLLILSLLTAIAGGILLGLQTVPSPSKRGEEPAITIAGPSLARFDEEGHRLWELEAESITVDKEHDRTQAEGVKLRFFKDNKVTLEVTAARLLLFNKSEEMELTGGIEAQDDRGLSFRTERLRWDPDREVLLGEGEVEVAQGKSRLTGKGFEYSPKEGRLRIEEKAHLILLTGE